MLDKHGSDMIKGTSSVGAQCGLGNYLVHLCFHNVVSGHLSSFMGTEDALQMQYFWHYLA